MQSVTVIGSGSIGKFYGGLFTLAGCRVCHLERSDFITVREQKYYEIELPDSKVIKIAPSQIEKDYTLLPKTDIVIISLKTTENNLLKKIIPHVIKYGSKIILLQNGIGNEEYLSKYVKNCSVVCGVTTTGVDRKKPGYVKVKHLGELKLAPFTSNGKSSCGDIKELITAAKLPAAICPKIQIFENHRILRWTKLLWNIPFSCLSLLFNTTVDILATQKQFQKVVRTIMQEICLVASNDGAEIEKEIEKLIELTATLHGFYPSMYYDFTMHKQIESQYIVYNVIDYAKSQNLNLPLLSFIYAKLSLLEKSGKNFSENEQEEVYSKLNAIIQSGVCGRLNS